MSIYLTSDIHLGHNFVSKLRGFESAQEHDKYIISTWNKTVQKHDDIWLLGDISLKKVQNYIDSFKRLHGNIHIVLGNHDTAHPMNRGWLKQWQILQPYSSFIGTEALLRHNGYKLRLVHHPYNEDHTEEKRHTAWRPSKSNDMILIHGHTHSNEKTSNDGIHIGWDAWKKPVKIEELNQLLEQYGKGE